MTFELPFYIELQATFLEKFTAAVMPHRFQYRFYLITLYRAMISFAKSTKAIPVIKWSWACTM